jgi:hypothetical protein
MTRRAENLDDILAQRRSTRLDRLLDRLDAAIISFGRTLWRTIVEGLAAHAIAEYAVPIEAPFDRMDEHQPEQAQEVGPVIQYTFAMPNDGTGDFEDLESLIEGVRAMRD